MTRLLTIVVIAALLGTACRDHDFGGKQKIYIRPAAGKRTNRLHRQRLPKDPTQLSSGNRLQLGRSPHGLRYCCLSCSPRPAPVET